MTKEKHIEEIAKTLCGDFQTDKCYECSANHYCDVGMDACVIYEAGYRKQSEWISVEERLPELETTRTDSYHRPKSVRVLCVCKQRSGKVFVKEGYYELFSNKPSWRIPGSIDSVTHWMPLPEAPKKGCAE